MDAVETALRCAALFAGHPDPQLLVRRRRGAVVQGSRGGGAGEKEQREEKKRSPLHFQCRGDLSCSDCASCVSRAMSSWRDVCGTSVAAQVQLVGCLTLYEVSGFPQQVSGVQMLFKTYCMGSGGGGDFEMRRDTAFAALQGGVATSYQVVYAMAQCEADLSMGDCGQCVT
ncbi:Cysteine-rich repeat secretory protein 11 [Dichanthelium oligosanthes]|uniref:Cysteine-rich repeat secretory protein 11 n=1 Tax=Dichanthelium oligosanthes TaxID=888268 RepID=A0A1E5W8Y8_9POAL|nr:Cysteine-rich repeat secretory protein 11 [Dichanthelium oligosanthes]